jgi:hypothetical protein
MPSDLLMEAKSATKAQLNGQTQRALRSGAVHRRKVMDTQIAYKCGL